MFFTQGTNSVSAQQQVSSVVWVDTVGGNPWMSVSYSEALNDPWRSLN